MELPLLLAGPILRRVDPGIVSVWTAFSSPAEVTLEVFEGRVAHDTTNPVFVSSADPPDPNAPPPFPGAEAIRIGEHLYLSMVSARIPPASGKVFESDRLYSYNLWIEADGGTENLHSLKLLETRQVSGTTAGPLGYADRMLPSFALPPSNLDDLQIAYGSCRRPGYDDGDAFPWMDQYLAERVGDPRTRLHQLFLGGDQIYADDVEDVLMQRVVELGVDLFGTAPATNRLPGEPAQTPVERVAVDKARLLKRAVDPKNPDAAYDDEPVAATTADPLPAGPPCFGIGNRLHLTKNSAQLTSEDGTNHLISLGEFAAAYLLYWSPACWGTDIPQSKLRQTPDANPTANTVHWLDVLTGEQSVLLPGPGTPARVPQYFFKTAEQLADDAKKDAEGDQAKKKHQKALKNQRSQRVHRQFLTDLWRAQRLLANVPTYMIFDDHDVTDDYFLSPMWRHRVLGTALGQTILTNAMTAYALFQDWGNDPRRYDQTSASRPELGGQLPGDLLLKAQQLFPTGASLGPDVATFTDLATMFGHDLDNQPLPDGQFLSVKPPITWHFTIDGPKHRVLALDNRTRRSYVSEVGPPGNVSKEALDEQIPKPPLPVGVEVLVVIAPLQVIGPPVIDEIVGRAIYRIFDAVHASEVADEQTSGTRLMPGTNPDALETWALDENTFEYLLSRLADYGRVVLLSGDVHNAASNLMSYWRGTSTSPARIAQFTSSGFKNVMPVYLRALDAKAMLLQQMLRAKLGVERLGWTRPAENLVLLPSGRTEDDLVAVTRAKLLRSPVLLPSHGWIDDNPEGEHDVARTSRLNPARLPDWRWRVTPLLDVRPDVVPQPPPEDPNAVRPTPIRAFPIDVAQVETQAADPSTTFAALRTVAVRHQHALDRMRNTRQMMFRSNFGICRFESSGDAITAIGEVYTEAIDPDTQLPVMAPYMVHRAPLGPLTEDPPADLRRFVIERKPIPEPTP
ncbi:MAG TPA: hypothetical protein VM429_02595 [Micropruina sp.]|nr:hypothetical protein [Micropruina sp.]